MSKADDFWAEDAAETSDVVRESALAAPLRRYRLLAIVLAVAILALAATATLGSMLGGESSSDEPGVIQVDDIQVLEVTVTVEPSSARSRSGAVLSSAAGVAVECRLTGVEGTTTVGAQWFAEEGSGGSSGRGVAGGKDRVISYSDIVISENSRVRIEMRIPPGGLTPGRHRATITVQGMPVAHTWFDVER